MKTAPRQLRGAFADYCQTVADGEYYFFDACVGGDEVVEGFYSGSLGVFAGFVAPYFVAPEGVVGKDVSSGAQDSQGGFIIGRVAAFVGVDEYEVILAGCRGEKGLGVGDMECYPVASGGFVEEGAEFVGIFVVEFYGVNECPGVVGAFGEAQGRVSGEGAEFENPGGAYHACEHDE